jgi:hypothetical protein
MERVALDDLHEAWMTSERVYTFLVYLWFGIAVWVGGKLSTQWMYDNLPRTCVMEMYVSREHREEWGTAKKMAEEALRAIGQTYSFSHGGVFVHPVVFSAEYFPPVGPRSYHGGKGSLCIHFTAGEPFLDWLATGIPTPPVSSPKKEGEEKSSPEPKFEKWQIMRGELKHRTATADYWSYQLLFLCKPSYWTNMLISLPTFGGVVASIALYISPYLMAATGYKKVIDARVASHLVLAGLLLLAAELCIRKYRMRKDARDLWSELELPPADQSFEDYLGLSPALVAQLKEQMASTEKKE